VQLKTAIHRVCKNVSEKITSYVAMT